MSKELCKLIRFHDVKAVQSPEITSPARISLEISTKGTDPACLGCGLSGGISHLCVSAGCQDYVPAHRVLTNGILHVLQTNLRKSTPYDQ